MSSVPPIQRLNREDIPNAPEWVENLISPLNLFMQSVWTSMNGGLVLGQNVAAQVKQLTFSTSSKYIDGDSSTFSTITYKSTLQTLTQVVLLGSIQKISSQQYVMSKPTQISWRDLNGVINIDYITGLEASTSYVMTLLSF